MPTILQYRGMFSVLSVAQTDKLGHSGRKSGRGAHVDYANHITEDDAKALGDLITQATEVANFLKVFGHDGRLMILCHLRTGPKSVTELENLLSSRQAVVSQQLARLRLEGFVSAKRDGQTINYSLLDTRIEELVGFLTAMFCKD